MSQVSLVVFTCAGKEHLLDKCIKSFEDKCNYVFNEKIICLDGDVKEKDLTFTYDKIVRNRKRRGYVESIKNGVNLVETEYFFWLEDDWKFRRNVDIRSLVNNMQEKWCQIVLNKRRGNDISENTIEFIDSSFSANPCLCRTKPIHQGIVSIKEQSEVGQVPFEHSMDDWLKKYGYQCKRLTSGSEALVDHMGGIESTQRRWHTPDASTGSSTFKISRSSYESVSLKNRLMMVIKLVSVFFLLIARQMWNDEAYDLSFRIYRSFQNKL